MPSSQEMELLILSKLKWDLSAVTPYDFLEHLLRQLQEDGGFLHQDDSNSNRLLKEEQFKKNTERIILNCAQEFRWAVYLCFTTWLPLPRLSLKTPTYIIKKWKYCKSIFIQVLPLHTEYALLSSDRNRSRTRDDHERRSGVRLWYQRAGSQAADSYQGGLCEFFFF